VLLTSCPFCGESIPDDREVHFCPSCGLNVRTIHCAGCSTELDAGWRFCVTCGRPAHPA
jgi:rRNA maturation endonuclease Nob1